MPRTRKLLIVLLTLCALTIGTAIAIDKRPGAAEPSLSSQELVDAAHSAYDFHEQLYQNARGPTPEDLYVWSKRCMTAERDLNPAAEVATKAVKAHLERMEQLEEMAKARHQAARASGGEAAAAKYYRIEAELMLAQTKQ